MNNSPTYSLRVKVGRIIAGFSFFLVIFYSFTLLLLKDSGLRDATHSILIQEAQRFTEQYAQDKTAPLPNSYSLRGFIGENTIPKDIAIIFPPSERDSWHRRSSGVYYKFATGNNYYSHHHMYVQKLPGTNEELFMYYRLSMTKEANTDEWKNVKQVALLGFVLVIVLLLVLRNFIHRALSPLSSLSQWIRQLDDKQQPPPLPDDIQDDEIGQLARNLFHALERINLNNEREQAFLRNASHELRTPIAIIRNTMDVIEHKGKRHPHPEIEAHLTRIRRASDTMKAVTEAILWLAISEYTPPQVSQADLKKLLLEVVEENRRLFENDSIKVLTHVDALGKIQAEKALVYITLDNLVRNAFQHCSEGEIIIESLGPLALKIENNRQAAATSHKDNMEQLTSGGFGLGLALVKKIAQKKKWHFEFSLENDRAVAVLDLSNQPSK